MKILIAEDEKRMNRALCEILCQEGYEVTSVDNGEDALIYCCQHMPPADPDFTEPETAAE